MRNRPFSAVLLTAALFLGACGQDATKNANAGLAAPRPLTKITVGQRPLLSHAPILIAQAEGYFADEGLSVEIKPLDFNTATIALTSGEIDVLPTQVRSGLFTLMHRGAPIRIVADAGHMAAGPCAPAAFAAPPSVADPILRSGSYRGASFALLKGGMTEYMIDSLLTAQHLTSKDVQFAQIPQSDAGWMSYQMDAVRFSVEPNLSLALSKGEQKIITPVSQVRPHLQYCVLMYGKRLVTGDPDLGKRFMRAYLRGIERYNEGKTQRNLSILTKGIRIPEEQLRDACWPPIAGDGTVAPEPVQEFLSWSRGRNYVEADMSPAEWWDGRFLAAAR